MLTAFSLFVVTVLHCCLAETDSSSKREYEVLKVLWQKELKNGIPEGYEKGGQLDGGKCLENEEEYVRGWIKSRDRNRQVIRVELVEMTIGRFKGQRFFHVTWIYNRRAAEEDGNERKAAADRLLIMDDIGPYKNLHRPRGGSVASRGSGYMQHDQVWNLFHAHTKYRHEAASPDVDELQISVWVTELMETVISDQDLLRYPVQYAPGLTTVDAYWVVKSKEGNFDGINWKSGDHYCVMVVGGGKEGSEAVARAYLERYPSTLTKDFKIDKERWGREEVESWLGRMKRTLDAWDTIKDDFPREGQIVKEKNIYYSINTCVHYLVSYVELPLGDGYDVMKNLNFEESEVVYVYLSAWWQKGRDKAYWDAKQRRIRIPEPGTEKPWWPFKK